MCTKYLVSSKVSEAGAMMSRHNESMLSSSAASSIACLDQLGRVYFITMHHYMNQSKSLSQAQEA